MDVGKSDGLELQFCSEQGASGAGCESRQTIGIVTFCGLLVATVIGISFPPAYFALFSRFGGKR